MFPSISVRCLLPSFLTWCSKLAADFKSSRGECINTVGSECTIRVLEGIEGVESLLINLTWHARVLPWYFSEEYVYFLLCVSDSSVYTVFASWKKLKGDLFGWGTSSIQLRFFCVNDLLPFCSLFSQSLDWYTCSFTELNQFSIKEIFSAVRKTFRADLHCVVLDGVVVAGGIMTELWLNAPCGTDAFLKGELHDADDDDDGKSWDNFHILDSTNTHRSSSSNVRAFIT